MAKRGKKVIYFEIPINLHAQFKSWCARRSLSIRAALEEYIRKRIQGSLTAGSRSWDRPGSIPDDSPEEEPSDHANDQPA